MVLCVCVCGGGGGVYVWVFYLVVCFSALYWGHEWYRRLVWLRCISQMLTIDHSFQSFLDNTVVLLATTNTELLLPMPLLTLCSCCRRCHCWRYAAAGDAMAEAMLRILAMPSLALCCYWRWSLIWTSYRFSFLALLDYVSRAHQIEIHPSSVCPCRNYFFCTQYAAFLPISVVALPGSYARTFF